LAVRVPRQFHKEGISQDSWLLEVEGFRQIQSGKEFVGNNHYSVAEELHLLSRGLANIHIGNTRCVLFSASKRFEEFDFKK
jgi:hypothetical protein